MTLLPLSRARWPREAERLVVIELKKVIADKMKEEDKLVESRRRVIEEFEKLKPDPKEPAKWGGG